MKLYIAKTSPYARKVLVLIHEKGALDRVQVVTLDPWADPAALHAATPVGKVPALVTDEGWCLTESWAIADYLDQVLPGPRLLPADGPDRWRVLRQTALAQGLMDAAFSAVIEGRRPAHERSPGWVVRQRAAITRALPILNADAAGLSTGPVDLAGISIACALDYLDFRHGDLDWRALAPELVGWYADFVNRASLRATDPR